LLALVERAREIVGTWNILAAIEAVAVFFSKATAADRTVRQSAQAADPIPNLSVEKRHIENPLIAKERQQSADRQRKN
jgi:hypothetical protein